MNKQSKILIVGHNDIIEQSLVRYFAQNDYSNVFSSSMMKLNTTIQPSVYAFFQEKRPEFVFLGSIRSGGIEANKNFAADFAYHNLESQNNVLYASWKFGVKKLLLLASSCIYPKECPQPIKEDYLLTGPLEETSEPYAVSKIAGVKLAQAYRKQYGFHAIAAVPATVYGPQAETDVEMAHVMQALVSRFREAVKEGKREVTLWGTGEPRREFLYCDDFVDACLLLMEKYQDERMINIGVGADVAIKELAEIIAKEAGFKGEIRFDRAKSDGVKQKLLDQSRIAKLGWAPKTDLREGIRKMLKGLQKEVAA